MMKVIPPDDDMGCQSFFTVPDQESFSHPSILPVKLEILDRDETLASNFHAEARCIASRA
jgi:hypothetical protein